MFVTITTHPNRSDWRELAVDQAAAEAAAAAFLALFPGVDGVSASIEPATIEDAGEFVAQCEESYAECRAEAGMGAMSLGYGVEGAYDAANAVERPGGALYAAAKAFLAAHAPAPAAPAPVAPDLGDDIPF